MLDWRLERSQAAGSEEPEYKVHHGGYVWSVYHLFSAAILFWLTR